ncbi:MAG: PTS sugar transporter subunit IIA [Chlamydiota bacterium]|nr:PTS sugar transporter subunit IIA [Chlamydiota bacterium]
MQLSVKELAKMLSVTERTIYRWVKDQSIPFYKVHDQYRFNRVDILDWATANKIGVSHQIMNDSADKDIQKLTLAEAIKKGGIYYRIEGKDKKSLLSAVVEFLNLPDDVKRESLVEAMLVREELGSTGFGEGIAIPHARYPVVTHIPSAIVSVCFLDKPIDYGSIDGKPVDCLFTLISPGVRSHLDLLSRIAHVLRDTGVKNALVRQETRDMILSKIEKAEQSLGH